jgi:acyl transferase domain-containing protein/surfactin synthase thioesterase subunit
MAAVTEVDERVVRLLHDARRALERERDRRTESIAIVGMGCRFPGGSSSPERFWQMLRDGVDATGDVPRDRWDVDALYDEDPDVPGKIYVKRGAFLDDIAGFEPEFFGISPREAVGLDPQQRLLLEVSWEALEDAGIAPHGLNGSATGVWIGQSQDDYAVRASAAGNLARIDPHLMLGNARSISAGRIAYVLGLHGPVLQVDTSCSSSLVALHLACQSLRSGECDLALVGGVSLIAAPDTSVALCKMRALARDGRCKTFDARADGYGRGEGCGVVVLKRVSDALAASDRIHAEVRGSALNHDGRSNGLTAPNGSAQEAVVRRALANAGLEPHQVQYVEAHGTGTPLGDPIEVLALNRVFGGAAFDARGPSSPPVYLGSVKTNIGHLEAAAGIAALMKATLGIAHGHIPPHLHLGEPSPRIPWRELPFRVPVQVTDWPPGAPRVAGVSAFGMSGTNVHVVLAEASGPAAAVALPRSASLVVLSARGDEALKESAVRLRDHLASRPELELDEVAATLAIGRSGLERRVARVLSSRAALHAALARIADGEHEPAECRSQGGLGHGAIAWLFPGQGSQLLGMGQSLGREFPRFRQGVEQAMAALDPHLDRPLASVMWAQPGTADAALLQQTAYTQPALFAFGWALAGLWHSFGVTPQWVAGHSLGELTAACVAEVFSLPEAARLVCARGRLMQALPHDGAMLAVDLDVDDASRVVEPHLDRLAIGAINAPGAVVLSGDRSIVQQLAEMLGRVGVAHERLPVSHAFHSPLVEPMLQAFSREASSIDYRPPRIPIVSNVSGALAGPEIQTAAYWVRHVREPVRFAAGVKALHAAGARAFFELGAKAVLLPLVEQTLTPSDVLLVPSGRSGKPETSALLEAVGSWWQQGGAVSWRGVFAPNARRCRLPTYPWQRQRYWLDVPSGAVDIRARPSPLYQLRWRPVEAVAPTSASGSWMLVETPCGARLAGLARSLRERGAIGAVSSVDTLQASPSAQHVVCFWERDGSVDTALEVAKEALAMAQLIVSTGKKPRLWWVTRGAVSILPHEVPQPGLAAIWGIGRALMLEHRALGCTLIDVDDSSDLADVLVRESNAGDGESQVAWRGGERHVLRLTQITRQQVDAWRALRRDGTVLITGGLGALGLQAARSLAQHGAKHLILASRRSVPSEALAEQLEALQQLGARVTPVELDVRDLDQLHAVMARIPRELPLRGVIHAAGVLDDGLWLQQNPARLESVMTPKVVGAWNLHRLTKAADLDLFVMFSSIAGTLGSAGHAGYAAANACLGALVEHRRALGLPAQSLAFGAFLSPEHGRAAFESALTHPEPSLVVADLRPHLLDRSPADAVPALWRELLPALREAKALETRNWRAEMAHLPTNADRLEQLTHFVAQAAARVLSIPSAESIPLERPLGDLGMDSLMAVELRRDLSRQSGVAGAAVLVTSRSSVASLASSLLEAMLRRPSASPAPQRVAAGACLRALSRPKARLFCFPYAGGTAEIFSSFDELAAMGIEVHTVSHTRAKAASAEVARQYLAEASAYIAERSAVPYAIFGHSLGGLIAWRVLEVLLDHRVAPPQLFAPSAAAFPEGLAGDFSDAALSRAFRRIAGDRAEATRSLLPDFIADARLWRELPRRAPRALPIRIAAFVGREDPIAAESAMRAWAARSSDRFSLTVVAGDHFYLSEAGARRAMFAEVARQLVGSNVESSATA